MESAADNVAVLKRVVLSRTLQDPETRPAPLPYRARLTPSRQTRQTSERSKAGQPCRQNHASLRASSIPSRIDLAFNEAPGGGSGRAGAIEYCK